MKEPTDIEIQGMMHAAETGGQYLDQIGKSDLATLTESEYMTVPTGEPLRVSAIVLVFVVVAGMVQSPRPVVALYRLPVTGIPLSQRVVATGRPSHTFVLPYT